MQEEIFGPILPILTYKSLSDAIQLINSKPKPLALYVFSSNSDSSKQIIDRTSSGAVAVNDLIIHFVNPSLPFGGVGESGMGAYHGKYSFKVFSHYKPVLNATTLDSSIKYPPYTPEKVKWLKFIFAYLKPHIIKRIFLSLVGIPFVSILLFRWLRDHKML